MLVYNGDFTEQRVLKVSKVGHGSKLAASILKDPMPSVRFNAGQQWNLMAQRDRNVDQFMLAKASNCKDSDWHD